MIAMGLSATAFSADLPRKAPAFEIHMIDGKNVPLGAYRGKVCVVAFISTTCPHCQKYVQILNGIHKDYAPKGAQVLAAAFNEGAQSLVPAFIGTYQPVFPLGWDSHADVLGFMQISILNPGFVPKVVFIDRGGTIRKQFEGQEDFFKDQDKNTREALDELLKEPAHKSTAKPAAKTAVKTVTNP